MPKAKIKIPKVETWSLDKLKAAPYNPREIDDDAYGALRASLERFGLADIPAVNKRTGHIIGGHQRIKVLEEAGIDKTPVVILNLSLKDEKALNITLNNPHITGKFTSDLQGMLSSIKVENPELLRSVSLDLLLKEEAKSGSDEAPPLPANPTTKPGDAWELGDHRLVCGDGETVETWSIVCHGSPIDLVVTSPPYNQSIEAFTPSGMHKEGGWVSKVSALAYADTRPEPEYQRAQIGAMTVWHKFMRDGASLFYNHKNRYRDKSVVSPMRWIPGPFTLRQEIVWSRPGSVTQNARMFLPSDERIYWMYKGGDFEFHGTTETKSWSSVWKISPTANKSHAVAFPVEIPNRAIIATTRRGDAVADPYAGSGTTLIACQELGRKARCIELEPAYCDVIVERWQNLTGGKAKLLK